MNANYPTDTLVGQAERRRALGRALQVVGLTLGMVATACQEGAAGGQPHARAVSVAVASVETRDVPVRLRSIGTVEALSTVRVIAQVTGMVQKVHFREGDFVRKGQLLFTIDTRPYSSSLAAAQAELQRNEAVAQLARDEAERAAQLHAQGLASDQDLSRARSNAAAAAAALGANRADVQSASLNVQFARMVAPLDGRTGSVLVQAGNVVRANDTTPLVVIRSLIPIHVRFSVPEQHLSEIRERMAKGAMAVIARPRGTGGKEASGTLVFVENSVDPATGTIDLKAEFPNASYELWPGQFVEVSLELSVEKNAMVVPETAVQAGQEGFFAYVVGADKRAHLRKVEVLRIADRQAVVRAGLKVGEQVVTEGQVKLGDGASVIPEPAPPTRPDVTAATDTASSTTELAPGPNAKSGADRTAGEGESGGGARR